MRTASSIYQGYLLDGVLRPDTLGGALSAAPTSFQWSIVKCSSQTLTKPNKSGHASGLLASLLAGALSFGVYMHLASSPARSEIGVKPGP